MNITVSLFTINAYDEVISLWKQSKEVALSDADSRKKIQAYLEGNPNMSFIARNKEGRIVGVVLCGHDGRRGYLYHLAVLCSKTAGTRGIGTTLVQECLSALSTAKIQKCHLFIMKDNADGFDFWKAIGWTLRSDIGVISEDVAREALLP